MTPSLYQQAKQIVVDLVEETPDKWPELIPRACGDNQDLRKYVTEWLSADPFVIDPPQIVKDHHIHRTEPNGAP